MARTEYTEVTVVVDGAVDQVKTFTPDSPAKDRLVRELSEWAAAHPDQHVEVFVLWHGHREDVEDCACAQYVQSHKPDYEWNGGGR